MPIVLPKCQENYQLVKDKCRCVRKDKSKKKNQKEKNNKRNKRRM